MARKGILTTETTAAARPAPRAQPRGAVGALQSSLTRLQENAVQEIDAALIDDAGVEDRLGRDDAADAQLRDSLKTYGQQVPVLLRPHPEQTGRFEIVYGRRRMRALKALGLPVKAMVRQLDDHALVMAQGQENSARQDLTFVEKASFAAQLQAAGYDRPTIAAALSIDLPMVSRMLKVGTAFSLGFLRQVGRAPSIGRDRWLALARMFDDEPGARDRAAARLGLRDFAGLTSDERFEAVFAAASPRKPGKTPPAPPRRVTASDGSPLAEIRRGARKVTLNVETAESGDFGDWMERNAERLMQDLHARWQSERN